MLLGDDAWDVGRGELPISGIYYFTVFDGRGTGLVSEADVQEVKESSPIQQVLSFISTVLSMVKDMPVSNTPASVRDYAESFALTFQ